MKTLICVALILLPLALATGNARRKLGRHHKRMVAKADNGNAYLKDFSGWYYADHFTIGTAGCAGVGECQFATQAEAQGWCNNQPSCLAVLQHIAPNNCAGGLGCFTPRRGSRDYSANWNGNTYIKSSYAIAAGNEVLDQSYSVGTNGCDGVGECQFAKLSDAIKFCNLQSDCLGVLRHPADGNCAGGKGCYTPRRGKVFGDQNWKNANGVTLLRNWFWFDEFAGYYFSQSYAVGTSGCAGVGECQFKTLSDAKAFCQGQSNCQSVEQHIAPDNCAGGFGCFTPRHGSRAFSSNWNGKTTVKAGYKLAAANQVIAGGYAVGTDSCQGVGECQFERLSDAIAFCAKKNDCKGVLRHPAANNCAGGKGCFTPRQGELVTDQNWENAKGLTFLKN